MGKSSKKSLKLPIFLMIAPIVTIIICIIAYAIVNALNSSLVADSDSQSTCQTTDVSSISEAAKCAEQPDSAVLFGDKGIFITIINTLLFLLSSVSIIAFIPCLVIGIVIYNKRITVNNVHEPTTPKINQRKWEEIE